MTHTVNELVSTIEKYSISLWKSCQPMLSKLAYDVSALKDFKGLFQIAGKLLIKLRIPSYPACQTKVVCISI